MFLIESELVVNIEISTLIELNKNYTLSIRQSVHIFCLDLYHVS